MNDNLEQISEYYSAKIAKYGATAQGVDWNGEESQVIRFKQLAKLFDRKCAFSVNDLGCGYGAFFGYANQRFADVDYHGFDISSAMINVARDRHKGVSNASFAVSSIPGPADFGIASGVFNVRLSVDDSSWQLLMEKTLDRLSETSRFGFAFNCLTSYSDPDKKRDYLFYADPSLFFDLCKRKYSREVSLLHDYGLYEFTIIVRTPC